MAVNHFKEHILPANEKKQQLAMNTASQRISFPTFNFPPWPSEFKLKDDQKKEISDMKSKVCDKHFCISLKTVICIIKNIVF